MVRLVQDREIADRLAALEHDLHRQLVELAVGLDALGRVVPDAELLDERAKAVPARGEEELTIRLRRGSQLENGAAWLAPTRTRSVRTA